MTSTSTATGNARKSLSIDPFKYIEHLPEFGGAQFDLQTFVDAIDELLPYMAQYDAASQKILLTCIKGKIKGKAKTIVEINNHVNTWEGLKEVLNNNFSDRKSSLQIYDELRSVIFKTNALDLYNEIQNILRRLNNKTKVEYSNNGIESSDAIQTNIQSALEIFKNKLAEPMKSILFSRNPSTFEESIRILSEGNYLNYCPFKNDNQQINSNKKFKNKNPQYDPKTNKQLRNNNNDGQNFIGNNSDNVNSNIFNNNGKNFNNNRHNFNINRSFSNNSRFFRSNNYQSSRQQNQQPEPMDVDQPSTSRIFETHAIENFPITASETN